jgi:molybdopterin synthase sulfur carrier subunit
MNHLEINYFALLREKSGCEKENLNSSAYSYRDLYIELNQKYQFDIPPEMIQVAVNDEFEDMLSQIIPNSKVVFIPPVAGG